MYDLINIMSNEYFFSIVDFIKNNPGLNPSKIAKKLKIHVATVQSYINILEKYNILISKEKIGLGRPSKLYYYNGGFFEVDLNEMVNNYSLKSKKIRDAGNLDIKYGYNIEKEIINLIIIGGLKGEKIKLNEKEGSFLWNVPNTETDGETIEEICNKINYNIMLGIEFTKLLLEKRVVEFVY